MTQFNESVRSLHDAINYLGPKTSRTIGNNTILERRDDGAAVVKYHGSPVIVYHNDVVILDSCGWKTLTTKERLNAFCPVNFQVYQERGQWILRNYKEDRTWSFADGITIDSYGRVFNAGSSNAAEQTKKLTSKIRQYAKDYAAALIAGEISEPSGADCWYCLMVDEHGKAISGTNHLLSHLEENYLVPSLLFRAIDYKPVCDFTRYTLGKIWKKVEGEVTDWEKSVLTRDVIASITHYLKHELGIAA